MDARSLGKICGSRAATMLLLAALALTWACGGVEKTMNTEGEGPDWILVEADVITGDPFMPRAAALAIRDGRITAVGSRAEVEGLATARTRLESLHGAVVVPGLTDAHGHVLALGQSLRRVDLRGCATYEEMLGRVARVAASRPQGTWIEGRGWDQTLWPGQAFPHHRALSAAVPDHPVFLERIDGHAYLANAAALRLAGIDGDTQDPVGGKVLRDAAGRPTGVLVDNAASLVQRVVPSPRREEKLEALELGLRHLAAKGLTAVHDAGIGSVPDAGEEDAEPGWEVVDLYRELLQQGRLPVRVYAMLGGNGVLPPPGAYFSRPPILGEGDGLLTVRAIKFGIDGALGSRGAALEEPYSDDLANRGLVTLEPARLQPLVREAMARGWQVAIHAIGDRGNRMALEVISAALDEVPGGRETRPRIEHAQVLAPGDLVRFAEAGVIASVQPTHATSDSPWAETRLGKERLKGSYAYASLLQSGARMACGSDFPVEDADPLAGLRAAIYRQSAAGEPAGGWRLEEALPAEAALGCFTSGAAHAAFVEDELGRLTPGYRADLTILDGDPLRASSEQMMRMRVLRTVVGGRIVHEIDEAR